MLFVAAAVLFVVWLLGIVGAYAIGAVMHVCLVVAVILFALGWLRTLV